MARHKKDYSGERLSAFIRLQLRPSDRQLIDMSAEEEGVSPTDFARSLLLSALGSHKIGAAARAERRAAITDAIKQLAVAGNDLNKLAHLANETRRIRSASAITAVCHRLIALMEKVPRKPIKRRTNPELRKLMAQMAAIGNNVQQLRQVARACFSVGAVKALTEVEDKIVETLTFVVPV